MVRSKSHTEKILNVLAIVLIIWSLYRAYFKTSLDPLIDEFIAKPLVFLLPHFPILFTSQNMTGMLLFKVMITDLILSLAVSFVFLARGKRLAMPIMIHAMYALSLFLFI